MICAALVAWSSSAQYVMPNPPSIAAEGYILLVAETGKILAEFNADEELPPASLTKIMTSYVAATMLSEDRAKLDDEVHVSVTAWRTPGSRMFIQEGTTVSLEDLLRGIVIQSGNDASVAVAEHLAGSEGAFADMMNAYGEQLELNGTYYVNSTGLPDDAHLSTARDTATLSVALIEQYPGHYAMYAEKEFTYNDITQKNRNTLLTLDQSVDGVKTGYTEEAKYCLAASALRRGMRLVTVVMGAQSDAARVRETRKLLSYGFRNFENRTIYDQSAVVATVPISFGVEPELGLAVAERLLVTIPRGSYENVDAEVDIPDGLEAPVNKGDAVGSLRLVLEGEEIATVPLVAKQSIELAGFFARVGESIMSFFAGLFN